MSSIPRVVGETGDFIALTDNASGKPFIVRRNHIVAVEQGEVFSRVTMYVGRMCKYNDVKERADQIAALL